MNPSAKFDSIVGMGDATGLTLTPIYNATDLQVVVGAPTVPLPASGWLFASALLGLGLITGGKRSVRTEGAIWARDITMLAPNVLLQQPSNSTPYADVPGFIKYVLRSGLISPGTS